MTALGHTVGTAMPVLARTAMERGNLYAFLADLYRRQPDAALLDRIREPAFRAALNGVGVKLAVGLRGHSNAALLDDLAVEYTRLFVGPGKHVSPHASVYIQGDGGLWGRSTVQVKDFIESRGFEFKPDYHGIPDHISVELEFMAEITGREAEAWEKGDRDRAVAMIETEESFLTEHFVAWAVVFCDKVAAAAEMPFYGELARLTATFLQSEAREIVHLAWEARGQDHPG